MGQRRHPPVIAHSYIGDLVIDLIAPSGHVFNLHNRAGGSADSLAKTYPLNLSGELKEGLWRVRIRDVAAADSGQLNELVIRL
jgi:subtilisin-like proprotein convertase family protein